MPRPLEPRRAQSWIVCQKPIPRPRLRLFCFPYAGAGPVIFHGWHEHLGPDSEIVCIQLPGREARLNETLLTSMPTLIQVLGQEIIPWLGQPFIFFGHSLGALIAFELARHLRRDLQCRPRSLIVSGRGAPQMPGKERVLHALPDRELIDTLQHINGTPKAVLENSELMRIMLPIVRADLTICDTYRYADEPPLDYPITVFGGKQDEAVSVDSLEAWRLLTTRLCQVQLFDGDHFFIHSCRTAVLQSVKQELQSCIYALRPEEM